MEYITRAEAKASGAKRFFTGKPCRYGHISERLVSNKKCLTCSKIKLNEWRKRNKDHVAASILEWRRNNTDRIAAYERDNIESRRARARRWSKNNLPTRLAANAARRAAKLSATPKWVDREAIKQFYKGCPPGYHVDHIVPLKSDKVCGLHVLYNLQYLPAVENLKKGNKLESV